MARRKKGAVAPGRGARCNICGFDGGKGGGLSRHVRTHGVDYDNYKKCYEGDGFTPRELVNKWVTSGKIKGSDKAVVIHVLVRRFEIEPGKRGLPRG
jgi:hypothetical protein